MTPTKACTLTTFEPRYLPEFTSLNRQWIEHYFAVEEMDLQQLENPSGYDPRRFAAPLRRIGDVLPRN